MRLLIITILGCCSCALSACVSTRARATLPAREQLLVGTWTADISFERWVIIRHADHTFSKSAIKIYDDAKPAIHIQSAGTWRVNGKRYCETLTSISQPTWWSQWWWSQRGRETCEEILELTPTRLNYFPEDAPLISERKVSGSQAFWLLHRPLSLTGTDSTHPVESSNQ